jgi:hypothetical protein
MLTAHCLLITPPPACSPLLLPSIDRLASRLSLSGAKWDSSIARRVACRTSQGYKHSAVRHPPLRRLQLNPFRPSVQCLNTKRLPSAVAEASESTAAVYPGGAADSSLVLGQGALAHSGPVAQHVLKATPPIREEKSMAKSIAQRRLDKRSPELNR